ncbi:MAG: NAD-dependent succinate-semialdehyde dehydrogenase [Candidatus Magasanikbacteria bacterium]|nr:NAD-dependent succinate-semialdehyde dehydrogenase [Candidatus Magasanikbacteria bacterium]
MPYISKNPYTEEILANFDDLSPDALEQKLAIAQDTFFLWRETTFAHRAERMKRLANILRERKHALGKLAATEMGKTLAQAIAEVEKCASVCDYYANTAATILQEEIIASDASASYVRFDPLGIILAVMPWNFPFWQVFRFAAPAVMAGNVGVLKHASNVPQCAQALEDLFRDAGFPEGVFQNLFLPSTRVADLIADDRIMAVTLTGSEAAGIKVAEAAGRALKKTVLELGGSDPFIILDDAKLDEAVATAVNARLQNNGQSCIAAKRFIVVRSIAEQFTNLFKDKFEKMVVGDPLDEKTNVGPLVSAAARLEIDKQVATSLTAGATLVTGGKYVGDRGYFYAPTILANVRPGMPAYHEEIFGPVAAVIVVGDADEAIRVANDTKFGLGASLWTQDMALAKSLASRLDAGAVFINGLVKSDPRLPFGGSKKSGYGRELSHYGIKEFVNIKTVWVK